MAKAAGILNLDPYLDRYPRELSGGQRQRVAMGRAIVRDPKVFLFDEPLSNLDAKLRVQMRGEIKALHQRLKTTTVYVTHDQIEAMTMADRIVVMHDGVVEQIGAPLELYDRPDNLFVAQFIGSPAMNIVSGTLRRSNGSAFVESAGGLRWPIGSRNAAEGQPVTLGVRPEHLVLDAGGSGVHGEIIVVEPMGAETELLIQAGEAQIVLMTQRPAERQTGRARGAHTRSCDGAPIRPEERTAARRINKDHGQKDYAQAPLANLVQQPRPRRTRPPVVDEEPGHPARSVRRAAGDRHLQHVVAGHAVQCAFPRARAARARRDPGCGRVPDRVPGDEPRRDADAPDHDAVPQPGGDGRGGVDPRQSRSTASCC